MNNDYRTAEEDYDEILEQVTSEHNVDIELLTTLIEYERDRVHLKKRRGARDDLRHGIEQWLEEQNS